MNTSRLRQASSCVVLASLFHSALVPSAAAGELLSAGPPHTWAARSMLEALDPAAQKAREDTVERALREFPGAAETLLLGLLSEDYLDALWADPRAAFGPATPADARTYNNRNFGIHGFAGAAPGVDLDGVRVEAMRTVFTSPLLLDLNLDGQPGLQGGDVDPHPGLARQLILADINYDLFPDLTEWVDGTDGLLVDPMDPSKVTSGLGGPIWSGSWNGADLVGTAEGYRDGFEKLALRDANGDRVISGAELEGLYVWQDRDTDAVIDAGELATLGARDIAELLLPDEGAATGRFTRAGQVGTMWDWWPSYALAQKRSTLLIDVGGSADLTKSISLLRAVTVNFTENREGFVPSSAFEEAGIDWDSLSLAGISPTGKRVLLADRGLSSREIQEGLGLRLIVVERTSDFAYGTLLLPSNGRSLQQHVFLSDDEVLLVHSNGGVLRVLDFNGPGGPITVAVHEAREGVPGFRAGAYAFRHAGSVYLTGYFYDAEQRMVRESIARLETSGKGGGSSVHGLVHAATLDSFRASARTLGDVRAEYLVSPELGYYIVRSDDGRSALVAVEGDRAAVIAHPVTLGGVAAMGSEILYFVPIEPGTQEVRVNNLANLEATLTLGRGDAIYPYYAGTGRARIAVWAEIDWERGGTRVRYHRWTWREAAGAGGGLLEDGGTLLETDGIGALRVSEDGSTYAYLGPEGLKIGSLPLAPPGGDPQFLRGNANGSPLPEDPVGANDISDAIFVLGFLFLAGPAPPCRDAADANDDGTLDISDPVTILNHLFVGGPKNATLPAPWPEPGVDPTGDALGCKTPQE